MRKIFLLNLFLILGLTGVTLYGCAGTSTVGDGKVDAVEAASIQVAVGVAMRARPDTIAPAYAISTALLGVLQTGSAIELPNMDTAIAREVDKLDLDPLTRANFNDLIVLVKAKVEAKIPNLPNLSIGERKVIIVEVLKIVQQSAAVRLGIK
jgi:hypothetical protein